MEACELCGAESKSSLGCVRCLAVYERLKLHPEGFTPFREWLEDVITTRVRAFVEAGHLTEAVDARVKEALDEHQGRYYHNRRPDY